MGWLISWHHALRKKCRFFRRRHPDQNCFALGVTIGWQPSGGAGFIEPEPLYSSRQGEQAKRFEKRIVFVPCRLDRVLLSCFVAL